MGRVAGGCRARFMAERLWFCGLIFGLRVSWVQKFRTPDSIFNIEVSIIRLVGAKAML